MNKFLEWLTTFYNNYGRNILIGLVILLIGWIVLKIIIQLVQKMFNRSKMDKVISKYIITVMKVALYALLIISVLSKMGVDMTGFVAVLTAVSLALSLALQDTLSNLANGMVIAMTKPFKEGDWIKVGTDEDQREGVVKEIKLFYTILTPVDNRQIYVPNKDMVLSQVTNNNANRTRRICQTYSVALYNDVELVKSTIMAILVNNDRVLLDTPPVVRLCAVNSDSIDFQVIVWVKTEDYWDLYYDLVDKIFNELKRANIIIPHNRMEVKMIEKTENLSYKENVVTPRTNDGKLQNNEDEDIFEKVIHKYKQKNKGKFQHRKEKKEDEKGDK